MEYWLPNSPSTTCKLYCPDVLCDTFYICSITSLASLSSSDPELFYLLSSYESLDESPSPLDKSIYTCY